jgi:hypothetical protein
LTLQSRHRRKPSFSHPQSRVTEVESEPALIDMLAA